MADKAGWRQSILLRQFSIRYARVVTIDQALACLRGLAVGDAFGAQFGLPGDHPDVASRKLPRTPWAWTDDTEMACSVYAVLRRHGRIDQAALAASFAEHYDAGRGYGSGTERLLNQFRGGGSWRDLAVRSFSGGSWGNGGAMRVAPLGAFHGPELPRVLREAEQSSMVTHAHFEGVAGAVAVAAAAALRAVTPRLGGEALLKGVVPFVPPSRVRVALEAAVPLLNATVREAAARLGTGREMAAHDTVPFALWIAARHHGSYEEALWTVAQRAEDVDTIGAITGGVLAAGEHLIPADWLAATEPLPDWIEV
jgi:ADP-ribosylglycohydrolase